MERFPFKTEVRIQYTVTLRFLFLPFTRSCLLVFEDTCKDGDSDAYKCVYVIVQSRKKEKALLSHRKRRCTRIALLFEFQRLKIGCFKTAVLKNTWPCYRCSPSFRNELLVVSWLVLCPVHAPFLSFFIYINLPFLVSYFYYLWGGAAYKDRSHSNDEKVLPETMYFATPRYKR